MADEIGFIQRVEKGRSHGVASLDEQGIVQIAQLPQLFQNPSAEADEDILLGQPLYLKQNGHLGLACGIDAMRSHVCGLALSSAEAGHACEYTNFGNIARSNWMDIIGYATLRVGQTYYLDAINAGKLTFIPPERGYLVEIAQAITSNAIALNISQSILL